MNILRVLIPLLLGITCLSGCATLVTGSRDYVSINSSPSGAKVTINGESKGTTPLRIKLEKKYDQQITFESEGYISKTYFLKRNPQIVFLIADILLGAPSSIVTDVSTGAFYRFKTDSVYVKLHLPGDSLDELEKQQLLKDSLDTSRIEAKEQAKQEKLLHKSEDYNSQLALKPLWNIVSIHATQLFGREWQFAYEKFIHPRWSVETAFGIRFPKKSATPEIIQGSYMIPNVNDFIFPFTQSYYSSIAVRKYQIQSPSPYALFYWSGSVFYRYSYYENEVYAFSAAKYYDTYASWESKYQHIPGVKFTIGWQFFILPYTSRKNITLDVFSGVGLRVIYEHGISYGRYNGYPEIDSIVLYPEPMNYHTSRVRPSIQAGLKLGFAWRK